VTVILPFTPLAEIVGFTPPSISLFLLIVIIVFFYIITAEMAKRVFYKKVKF